MTPEESSRLYAFLNKFEKELSFLEPPAADLLDVATVVIVSEWLQSRLWDEEAGLGVQRQVRQGLGSGSGLEVKPLSSRVRVRACRPGHLPTGSPADPAPPPLVDLARLATYLS